MLASTLEVVLKEGNEKYDIVKFWGNMDSFGLSEKKQDILKIVDVFQKKYLVFDFSDLNFVNSESISFLMQINEKLQSSNNSLVLVEAKKNVLDVLDVIGLLETMPYFKRMDDFLRSIRNDN